MCLRGVACLRLFGAHFLAAPSPLSLLFFKFVLVSMGVCSGFFFFVFLGDAGDAIVVGVAGDDVGVAGDADTAGFLGFGSGIDAGFFPDDGAGVVCFGGAEVVPVPPPLFRGPLPLSGHLGPALLVACFGLDLTRPCTSACLLMVVVAAVAVVVVVAAAAFSLLSVFWGQNLAIWPICLHPQHLGRLPSTTTIIYRSPLIRVSGMALCDIIAEGFRFMPLSLVRVRTVRLSTWVSWVQD